MPDCLLGSLSAFTHARIKFLDFTNDIVHTVLNQLVRRQVLNCGLPVERPKPSNSLDFESPGVPVITRVPKVAFQPAWPLEISSAERVPTRSRASNIEPPAKQAAALPNRQPDKVVYKNINNRPSIDLPSRQQTSQPGTTNPPMPRFWFILYSGQVHTVRHPLSVAGKANGRLVQAAAPGPGGPRGRAATPAPSHMVRFVGMSFIGIAQLQHQVRRLPSLFASGQSQAGHSQTELADLNETVQA